MYRVVTLLALLPVAYPVQAAEPDALAISTNIQARHLPYQTILDPIFAAAGSNQIIGYTRCGDSAIWTGHYLAAEAFRYQVTQSPDALTNVQHAIAGIQSLVDVTGTDLLARCAVPLNSPYAAGIQSEESSNGIYTNAAMGDFWVGNTSRDEYSGVIFGLGVAYDMVSDPGTQSSINTLVTRILNFLLQHAWVVVMPDGSVSTLFEIRPDQQLALLQVGQHVNPTQFAAPYSQMRSTLAPLVALPIGVDTASDDSYFKFNLDYINLYNLIRLENTSTVSVYRTAYNILRQHTAPHQNAFFDIVDRGLNGADAGRDNEAEALLNAWLARPRRDPTVNLQGVVPVCGSQACQPIPVPLRVPTDFLWQRTPFQLSGGGSGVIEGAGIDYILPYWMARYYGLNAPFVVQSAADASFMVAPESIASIYGSNLSAVTAQATSQPLPLSLGGVTVTVQDVAGVSRPAPLLYVSPGQINFQVPSGTVAGSATFILNSGGVTSSAMDTVENVAPAIFTATGNGLGVPAATAIQTQAPGSQYQSPVSVFQCTSSGCAAVPIELGVDTPVYLTLYCTGIRNRTSLANVSVTINGAAIPVMYAGPQGQFAGLDQVNVPLTLNLRGSNLTNVVLTVDGQTANIVTIDIQ